MLLYLVRHGETDWNVQRKIQGSTDIPLNATGRAQAAKTGALLAGRHWDAIISSPLSRAFETASIIAAAVGLLEPTVDARLVERNYGEAEGLSDAEIDTRYPGDTPVPGRETRGAVVERVRTALMDIARSHPDQSVLVVSHGGVIRGIVNAVDPDGKHGMIRNGSVHSFSYTDGDLSLIAFDDPIDEQSEEQGAGGIDQQNELERREAR